MRLSLYNRRSYDFKHTYLHLTLFSCDEHDFSFKPHSFCALLGQNLKNPLHIFLLVSLEFQKVKKNFILKDL